jgi:hypothetical protein
MNEDIWCLIKTEFLGLGKNPRQYFKEWCPTTPGAQAIKNSEEFHLYQANNRRIAEEEDSLKSGPTWVHWRKEMLTIWPGRGDRPYAYDIIRTVHPIYDIPVNKKIGRIHIWKLYQDLHGFHGPSLQDKAQWKIQVDGKKVWDRNFSEPWMEVLKSLSYPIEEDDFGPSFLSP